MRRLLAPWFGTGSATGLPAAWFASLAFLASLQSGCNRPASLSATGYAAKNTEIAAAELPSLETVDTVRPEESKRVLVVFNSASKFGREIAAYYAKKRQIPTVNMLALECTTKDNVSEEEYQSRIESPIRVAIAKLSGEIDFIVLTKGVPIRIKDDYGYAVDSFVAGMNLRIRPIEGRGGDLMRERISPYFGKREPFNSKKFGFFLVSRLDGYELSQCKRLVDLSLASKSEKGPFFFDAAENRRAEGYRSMQDTLYRAANLLNENGFQSRVEDTIKFEAPAEPLAGYASWGSNDSGYDETAYRKIRFKPGAIGETFVSTSGRRFDRVGGGNQSLVGDLIEGGITGVKGYVSEPFTDGLARVDVLFERYTAGFNLAESFYMASPLLKWKDVVIGDPLCRPYRK